MIVAIYCYYKLNKQHKTISMVESTLIALGNAFGFLIIFLAIGYSLVAIPRDTIKKTFTRKGVTQQMSRLDLLNAKKQELLIILENKYKLFKGIKEGYQGDERIEKWLDIGMAKMDQGIIAAFGSGMTSYYDEGAVNHALKNLTKKKVIKMVREIDWTNDSYKQTEKEEAQIKKTEIYYRKNRGSRKLKIFNWTIRICFILLLLLSLFTLAIEVSIPFQRKFKFNIYQEISKVTGEYAVYYFYLIIILYLVVLFNYANVQLELKYFYRLRKKGTDIGSILFYITLVNKKPFKSISSSLF